MADKAHELTDYKLEKMERHLSAIYRTAGKEIQQTADEYFRKFAAMDAKKAEQVKAGLLPEQEYKTWRKNKLLYGERFKHMQEQLAEQLLHTNETAMAYINDQLPEVYALNYNAIQNTVEQIKGYSFTLTDANTVKLLSEKYQDLLPKKKMDPAKDIPWNMKKVQAQVLQGIMQGDSIPKITKRMQAVGISNKVAAVRTARTTVTASECMGREDSYRRAQDDGIKLVKVWMATLDGRTRHSHRLLDGVTAKPGESFEIPTGGTIRFPGDPHAHPAEVYNCRCTTVADTGVSDEPWVPTGTEVDGMSYEEWQGWKHGEKPKPKKKIEETGYEKETEDAIKRIYTDRKEKFDLKVADFDDWKKFPGTKAIVDLSGIDADVAGPIARQISGLSQKYYSSLNRISVGEKKEFFGDHSFARTVPISTNATTEMYFNPLKINNTKRIRELSDKGWSVKIPKGKENEYVVTHEFAHSVFNRGLTKKNFVGYDQSIQKKAEKEIDKIFEEYKEAVGKAEKEFKVQESKFIMMTDFDQNKYNSAKKMLEEIKISEYSMTNSDEFMAESFAQHEIGSAKSKYAEAVVLVLKKYFGR